MKNAIIIGFGNIGSTLVKKIPRDKIDVKYIIRSSGVFDADLNKIADQKDWKKFVSNIDVAFISLPTTGNGETALEYSLYLLEKGKVVITCEKASIAYHWDLLKKYRNTFRYTARYTASVGGGTKMLKRISFVSPDKIQEIKGVVNGTLNYFSDNLKQGKSKEKIVKEILEKGYSEPGAKTSEEIIKVEMNDAVLKTVIIANHSGIFNKTINIKDVEVVFPAADLLLSKRCIVSIDRNKIKCGFIEDNNADWLPSEVNNVLYINGDKKAFGPGAGAEATALAMIDDSIEL